jgi:two-component system alkaline phosphatase synthesis response regulator PhoP
MEPIRILVADDNRLLLAITKDALAAQGFQVITVGSGMDVYREVLAQRPHLILLDIMMPEIDGIEICRNLKRNPATRNIVIVIHSAKRDLDLMDLAYEAGAEGFIMKSNQIEEMVGRIQEIVREKIQPARD